MNKEILKEFDKKFHAFHKLHAWNFGIKEKMCDVFIKEFIKGKIQSAVKDALEKCVLEETFYGEDIPLGQLEDGRHYGTKDFMIGWNAYRDQIIELSQRNE